MGGRGSNQKRTKICQQAKRCTFIYKLLLEKQNNLSFPKKNLYKLLLQEEQDLDSVFFKL